MPSVSSLTHNASNQDVSSAEQLRAQLSRPLEMLGVLLIIGGDIVQKAIAQLSGRSFTPVAFSFGWVAYSFSTLLSIWGDGRLMPVPDCEAIVINAKSGNAKRNESWVIGRLIRDLEIAFHNANPDLRKVSLNIIQLEAKDAWTKKLYKIDEYGKENERPDPPHRDKLWYSFGVCTILQIGLSLAPVFVNEKRDWRILFITGAGTLLAVFTGSLPKFRDEKFACRVTKVDSDSMFILTRGNSHHYAFVIRVPPGVRSLNLEDLAVSESVGASTKYRALFASLALLWVTLLICSSGMTDDTWYLLGVGGLGMIHNIIVAGYGRKTEGHGIPLRYNVLQPHVLSKSKGTGVMSALEAAEIACPGIGLNLLPVFFPGELRSSERTWWEDRRRIRENLKSKKTEPQAQGGSV